MVPSKVGWTPVNFILSPSLSGSLTRLDFSPPSSRPYITWRSGLDVSEAQGMLLWPTGRLSVLLICSSSTFRMFPGSRACVRERHTQSGTWSSISLRTEQNKNFRYFRLSILCNTSPCGCFYLLSYFYSNPACKIKRTFTSSSVNVGATP